MKDFKAKKCKICNGEFQPRNGLQKCCSIKCALEFARVEKIESEKKKNNKMRKEFRENDKSFWAKKAQTEFNKFIRLRDKNDPCISCGRHHQGQWHAGHYKTVGGHQELRFNEDNCHKQCSVCNNYKSGNLSYYRANLIEKIGIERVEAIENYNEPTKHTIDDLKRIYNHYNAKNKEVARNA